MLLFSFSSLKIFRNENRIYFKYENGLLFFSVATFILGGLVFFITSYFHSEHAYSIFFKWVSSIVFLSGFFLIAAVLSQMIWKSFVFDEHRRVISYGNKRIPFEYLNNIRIQKLNFANAVFYALVAEVNNKTVFLIKGIKESDLPILEQVAVFIQKMVGSPNLSPSSSSVQISYPKDFENNFISALLVVLGGLWSFFGYYLAPDLIFTRYGVRFGFLFWPFGLWIMTLGLGGFLGLSVRDLRRISSWEWKKVLFLVIFIGSYGVMCYVRKDSNDVPLLLKLFHY